MKSRPYDEQLRAALTAGRERRYLDAVTLLQELLRKSDEYPDALLYLGRSYHALGELPRAVAVFSFFLRLAPESAAGHFFLGRSYLAMSAPRPAFRHLKRSAELRPGFVPALSLAGVAALRARRPDVAIRYLERAVEGAPDNPGVFTAYLNALLTQAIKLFREGDLTASGQILQFILRNREESVTAHVYLARIFRDLGKGRPALDHFDAASRLMPDDSSLRLQKAAIYLQLGEQEKALEELKGAATGVDAKAFLTRDPTELARLLSVTYFQNKRYREAISHGLAVLRETPTDAQVHVVVAESFRNLGELDKARNHYERAVESDKGNPDIQYGLSMVLFEQGSYAELIGVLQRIGRSRPGDQTVAYYMALASSRMGDDPRTTIGPLQEQLRSSGPDPFLMLALATDYLRAGMPDFAEGWFRRTLKLRSDDRQALVGLIDSLKGQENKDGIIEAYRAYLKLYPLEHSSRRELSKLLVGKELYGEAAVELEQLVGSDTGNRQLRELLATCYRKSERYADAIVLLKELLIADPSSEEHLTALVYCLDRSGDSALATALLERALPAFPKSTHLRLILGVLLLRSGKLERAGKIFRDVVATNPKNWVAHENLGRIHERLGDKVFAAKFYARARSLKGKAAGATAAAAPRAGSSRAKRAPGSAGSTGSRA